MQGISCLARFKPWKTFLGREVMGKSIYEFLEETRSFDKKQKKRYKGYINALEALDQRLNQQAEESEVQSEELAPE